MSGSVLIDTRGQPQDDRWTLLRDGATRAGSVLLPLADYLAAAPTPATGVWLAPADDTTPLVARLALLPVIAIDFLRFADGRGYSQAALLRRAGFAGELRAVGEVLIDQLALLRRVGFTTFALRADQRLDDARVALARWRTPYQGAHDQPLPAYRRHLRPAAATPEAR